MAEQEKTALTQTELDALIDRGEQGDATAQDALVTYYWNQMTQEGTDRALYWLEKLAPNAPKARADYGILMMERGFQTSGKPILDMRDRAGVADEADWTCWELGIEALRAMGVEMDGLTIAPDREKMLRYAEAAARKGCVLPWYVLATTQEIAEDFQLEGPGADLSDPGQMNTHGAKWLEQLVDMGQGDEVVNANQNFDTVLSWCWVWCRDALDSAPGEDNDRRYDKITDLFGQKALEKFEASGGVPCRSYIDGLFGRAFSILRGDIPGSREEAWRCVMAGLDCGGTAPRQIVNCYGKLGDVEKAALCAESQIRAQADDLPGMMTQLAIDLGHANDNNPTARQVQASHDWLERAMAQGYPRAFSVCADGCRAGLYGYGVDPAMEYQMLLKSYQMEPRDLIVANNLACCYLNGAGVAQDLGQARALYQAALDCYHREEYLTDSVTEHTVALLQKNLAQVEELISPPKKGLFGRLFK